MSLLMDALKRAENAKQESLRNPSGGLLPTPADMLIIEPISNEPAKAGASPLPDLALHLAAVDADLAQAATSPAETQPTVAASRPPAPPSRPPEPQETVRSAFAAKQASTEPSRRPLWLALGTLGLAGIAIGAYVWYQMNMLSHGSLALNARPPMAQSALPPASPKLPAAPPAALPPAERASSSTAIPAQPIPRPEGKRTTPERILAETPESLPIRLTRTRPEADRSQAQGYASLQQGDTERSRQAFEQSLRSDPNNTDTLLALAAIAQRQGRLVDAESLRQRALVANPSDPATQAAVLNSPTSNADPQTAESRLKSLLSSQPESAPLNFALGNLYARQGRWTEAQQVYFNAVASDGDNPDYLFNLAVSLDHLRQPRLAAQHYRLALEASTKRPAGFARDSLEKRLGELQSGRQP